MDDGDDSGIALAVVDANGRADHRQGGFPGFRPLDEDDRVVEVRLEVAPLCRGHIPEAVEIEMRHLDPAPGIAVADREGRARHRALHSERAAGSANESRLAGAEVSGDGDDIAVPQRGRELGRYALGLFRRVGGQNRPSWTAGSALTSTGFGAGASTTRPSSSGRRPKSDCKTSSMRGVYSAAAGWYSG